MSVIANIVTSLAAVDEALANVGHASFSSLGAALDKVLQDVRSAATADVEQTLVDAVSAAVPELGALISVAETIHKSFPQIRGADWSDPVWRAQDDNPYADNGSVNTTQGE